MFDGGGENRKIAKVIDSHRHGRGHLFRALRAELNSVKPWAGRRHECRRGTHECVRHGGGARCNLGYGKSEFSIAATGMLIFL